MATWYNCAMCGAPTLDTNYKCRSCEADAGSAALGYALICIVMALGGMVIGAGLVLWGLR